MNKEDNPFALDVVSIRLVKDAEILSDKPFRCPEDVIALLRDFLAVSYMAPSDEWKMSGD